MAKPDKPIMSLRARGTIGDTLTFQHRSHTNIVRTKPIPSDPNTVLQQRHRTDYLTFTNLWQSLTPVQKAWWNTQARRSKITGFNYFLSFWLKAPPSLVGRWYCQEGSGTTLLDSSRHSAHGTLFGPSWHTLANGLAYLTYDHIDDYARIPHRPQLNPAAGDFSIECVFNSSAATASPLVEKFDASDYEGYILRIRNDGKLQATFREPPITPPQHRTRHSAHTWNDGAWHHVIASYHFNKVPDIIVDGSLDNGALWDVGNITSIYPTVPLLFGQNYETTFRLDGDQVLIWLHSRYIPPVEASQRFDRISQLLP